MWLDNWHPFGPLFSKFGSTVVYNLGRNLHTKVATIIAGQSWHWPRCRNAVTRDILRATPVIWNLTRDNKFSIKSSWNAIGRQDPKVNWSHIIWFTHYVSHWSIIQLLVKVGRLAIKYSLLKWDMTMNDQCVLCSAAIEAHVHLFFQCSLFSTLEFFVQKHATPVPLQ